MPNYTETANTVPISMFNRGLAEKIFEDVKRNGAKVVMKNNVPECVLLSPADYFKLMDEVNDARLLALATERMANYDASKVISEADVLEELGLTSEDIEDIKNIEFE